MVLDCSHKSGPTIMSDKLHTTVTKRWGGRRSAPFFGQVWEQFWVWREFHLLHCARKQNVREVIRRGPGTVIAMHMIITEKTDLRERFTPKKDVSSLSLRAYTETSYWLIQLPTTESRNILYTTFPCWFLCPVWLSGGRQKWKGWFSWYLSM